MKTFVIAEAGVNHNGDLAVALDLVDAAAEAGADAIKFQTFNADALVARKTETVAYQRNRSGISDQHELLHQLELSHDAHRVLFKRAAARKIEFMSTAFDESSAAFLVHLGISRIKIPSGEITNLPFVKYLASFGLPVFLSTGMSDLDEVKTAVDAVSTAQRALKKPLPDDALTVLHCTSAYPTPDEDANLAAIATLKRELALPVGYSDHTSGIFVAPIAVAMGACVIEKHITLDRNLPGPDHLASIEPDDLRQLVIDIRRAELLAGDGLKVSRPVEAEARMLVRRGLKAARDLPPGHVLTLADIAILRPAQGLPASNIDAVVGAIAKSAIAAGVPLSWELFSNR